MVPPFLQHLCSKYKRHSRLREPREDLLGFPRLSGAGVATLWVALGGSPLVSVS